MELIKDSFLDCQLSSTVVQGHENVLLGAVRLPVRAESVSAARRFVRLRLGIKSLPDELVDAAELIASELATNVVRYHDWDLYPVMLIGICRVGAWLHLEVHDTDPAVPMPRQSTELAESGRGLLVVEACSDTWGIGRTAEGKFVWASLLASWPDKTHGH